MKTEKLIELATHRKQDVYGGYQRKAVTANNYYEQRDKVPVPKALNAVAIHLNTARKIIDTGDQHYMKDNPVTEVRPAGRSQTDEDKARDTQVIYDACLKHMVMPVIKQAPKKLLLRGVGILGLWFNDEYYTTEELSADERDAIADRALWDFPLQFKCYDPLYCYPSRAMQNQFQPRDMLIMYEVTTAEAMALVENHPSWKWKPKNDETNVTFIDYYTNKTRTVLLGDKKLYDGENPLGFVPFVIFPAGFGQSSPLVEEEWRPMFFAEEELMTYLQTAFSAEMAILLKKAWPQRVVKGLTKEQAKVLFPDGKMPTSPDDVITLPPGVDIVDLNDSGPQHQWMQSIGVIDGMIDVPRELSGNRSTGVYSAEHAESMMSHQRARYKDALMNLQRGLEFYLRMCGRALKVLGNDISVHAFDEGKAVVKNIKVDRLDERCEVKVKLVSEAPDAQMIKRSQGIAEVQAGVIDLQTHHTQFCDYSIEESERIQDRIILDEYMKQPFMQQLMTAIIAKEKGDNLTAQIALAQFEAERGGANNVTAKTGSEMVPRTGETAEGAPTPYESEVMQ